MDYTKIRGTKLSTIFKVRVKNEPIAHSSYETISVYSQQDSRSPDFYYAPFLVHSLNSLYIYRVRQGKTNELQVN